MNRGMLQMGAAGCVLAIVGGAGCRQKSGSAVSAGAASVRLINAVPDAGGLDVSVAGRRVWSRAGFRSSTGYQAVAAGTYPVRLEAAGPGTTLLTRALEFGKGHSYTLLALGQAERGQGGGRQAAEVQVLDDARERPEDGKASVRLINASPGAPPLDLVVNTIVGLKGVGYGRRSGSLALAGGQYDLQLAAAGTTEILSGPVPLTLAPGQSYTLIAMGRAGGRPSLSLEAYPDK